MIQLLNIKTKYCTKCKVNKALSDFRKTSKDRLSSWCKYCYRENARLRNINIDINTFLRTRVSSRKSLTKQIFEISFNDVLELYLSQNGKCAITKVPMTCTLGKGTVYTNASLDRIDSSKGYIKDNIQLVCYIVNSMKNTLTMREFIEWCNLVVNNSRPN